MLMRRSEAECSKLGKKVIHLQQEAPNEALYAGVGEYTSMIQSRLYGNIGESDGNDCAGPCGARTKHERARQFS